MCRRYASGETKVRTSIVPNLIACGLLSASLSFAQNVSQPASASLEQSVELQNLVSIESPDPSGSGTTSTVPEAVSTSGPQDIASGNASGNGGSSGNPGSSGNAGPSASSKTSGTGAASATTPYVFPSSGQMNRYWLRNAAGPKAFAGGVFTASWNTWVNTTPKEWHRDGTGWGKR